MKKRFNSSIITILLFCSLIVKAQSDPGTANLKHQWTFDDGTAKDAVSTNPVNGTLVGGATIVNKALKLSAAGQYLSFSGSALALKDYPVISQEIWFTSIAGANTDNTMLSYFGNASGGLGYNYIFTSVANLSNFTRTVISNGTYNSEVGVSGPEYDDGVLHQLVSVIRSDMVILYIDGVLVSQTANTKPLTTIGTSLAYLGKSGYTADDTWIGYISKFSIYNKSLSADEVQFLYQQGAEQTHIITSLTTVLSFDSLFTSETIKISGFNLSDSITIVAPAGITIDPAKLDSDVYNAPVAITYDGTTIVDGNITFTSDTIVLNIPVKSYSNACFSKLYPDLTNLVPDPYISSLTNFSEGGSISINTDPAYVYCGATSGKVSGSNGSLGVTLTGNLKTNTIYRVKAKVYVIGGLFQISISGWSGGQSDYRKSISTTGSWQDVDFTFTTGATLGSTQSIFFNNNGLSGTTGYIDNWEMYEIPKVYTSASSLSFPTHGSEKVTVRGVNLLQDITISGPAGFSINPTTMPAGVNGDTLTITFNGAASTDSFIYFTSGSVKDSIYVSGSVDPTLVTSVTVVSMDEISNSTSFKVTGYNLTTDVTFTAPAGITFSPSSLPSLLKDSSVTVTYDGIANSSGTITLSSGTATANISVLAARNDECFTQLYPDSVNLVVDPTCNTNTNLGFGNISINADLNFVYCGARSAKIAGNGTFNRNLTGTLKPNSQYRVKAKVYKSGPGEGQNLGKVTYTLAIDSASLPEPYRLIKIAMDSACKYYSKYTPFVYDIYVYYSSGIPTAQASYHGSIGFGPLTQYMWVGTAMHEMAHFFGSGTTTTWQSKIVNGVWTGTVAANLLKSISGETLKGDMQHYWPYGINQKSEITNFGSQAAQTQALINAVKIVKAMLVDDCGLPTNNPAVGVGVYGWDASSADIYHEVTIPNSWQDVDFTFITGNTLKTSQTVYFKGGSGYIDNWEMYEIPLPSEMKETNQLSQKVYFMENKIVTEIALTKRSEINISVYDLQGKLMVTTNTWYDAGYNKKVIDVSLPNGIYIVKIISDEISISKKIISF
jgi:hypothetical protein